MALPRPAPPLGRLSRPPRTGPWTSPARRRRLACATATTTPTTPPRRRPLRPPPPTFTLPTSTTRALISSTYPSLLDLVDDGTLLAIPRSPDYKERRADGYVEPQLILLVATAHLSASSPAAVDRVIRAVHPDAVVVELCRSRTGLLAADEDNNVDDKKKAANPFALTGSLTRSAELGGPAALAARVALARWAAQAADALTDESNGKNIRLGDDARAAAAAARAVGAALVLGDRPIELTLARAWAALAWPDRLGLLALAAGRPPPATGTLRALIDALAAVEAGVGNSSGAGATATAVDALDALRADPAAVAAMVSALDAASPALAAALLHERDEWIAWSAARSRAVCGARAVVCVLGAGHARGVAYHLLDHAHRPLFKELAGQGVSRREQRAAAVRRLGIDAVIGAGAWAAWEAVHSSGGLGGGGGL